MILDITGGLTIEMRWGGDVKTFEERRWLVLEMAVLFPGQLVARNVFAMFLRGPRPRVSKLKTVPVLVTLIGRNISISMAHAILFKSG